MKTNPYQTPTASNDADRKRWPISPYVVVTSAMVAAYAGAFIPWPALGKPFGAVGFTTLVSSYACLTTAVATAFTERHSIAIGLLVAVSMAAGMVLQTPFSDVPLSQSYVMLCATGWLSTCSLFITAPLAIHRRAKAHVNLDGVTSNPTSDDHI